MDEVTADMMEAIAEALGDAYDCTRVWSAWQVGTMSADDFVPVADDWDRLREIGAAVIEVGTPKEVRLQSELDRLTTANADLQQRLDAAEEALKVAQGEEQGAENTRSWKDAMKELQGFGVPASAMSHCKRAWDMGMADKAVESVSMARHQAKMLHECGAKLDAAESATLPRTYEQGQISGNTFEPKAAIGVHTRTYEQGAEEKEK